MTMAQIDQLLAGRYRLGKLLGSGGFGAVYLAEDMRLQRPVAIKVCSTQRLPPDEAQEAATLFQREALTLARLRHSGLTAVWDYFNQDDEWFLVMEYVPGETLREVLVRAGGRLSYEQALNYVSQLCDVLRYLHTQPVPVVFRDLKPANIIVTPNSELKLIDFGIARLFSPGKTADTAQFGTPGYAPPEQYGGQTEPRSDIYSLGVLTHQMLTGHNPGSTPFSLPPARALNPALSAKVETALMCATAHTITDRFASVDAFCAALRDVRATAVMGATIPMSLPPRQTEPPSHPLWTPPPRTLPQAPQQTGGVRGLILVALSFVLLLSLGYGAWLVRDQITSVLADVLPQGVTSGGGLRLPGVVAYVAPGPGGGEDVYLRVGVNVERLTNHSIGVVASLPAISPDHKTIAYGVFRAKRGVDGRDAETLWIVDATGANRRRLLTQYEVARAPSWSPDGRSLLVEVGTPGNGFLRHDIVEVNFQSGQVIHTLAASNAWEGGPVWSPDGERIAFMGRLNGSKCMRVYLKTYPDGEPIEATPPSSAEPCTGTNGDYWPAWSPDGKRLAFVRRGEGLERIATIDLTQPDRVANVWRIEEQERYRWSHPTWSPDGKYLLLEEIDTELDIKSIQRLEIKTGTINPLNGTTPGGQPDWR